MTKDELRAAVRVAREAAQIRNWLANRASDAIASGYETQWTEQSETMAGITFLEKMEQVEAFYGVTPADLIDVYGEVMAALTTGNTVTTDP